MKAGGQLSGTLVHASLDYSHGKQKQKQNKKSSGEVFIPHMARDKELVIGRREEKKEREREREKLLPSQFNQAETRFRQKLVHTTQMNCFLSPDFTKKDRTKGSGRGQRQAIG